jgi:hypothetical protein
MISKCKQEAAQALSQSKQDTAQALAAAKQEAAEGLAAAQSAWQEERAALSSDLEGISRDAAISKVVAAGWQRDIQVRPRAQHGFARRQLPITSTLQHHQQAPSPTLSYPQAVVVGDTLLYV